MISKVYFISFIFSISTVIDSYIFGFSQSVKVRGQVYCNGVPYYNVIVQLMEEDRITSDDIISVTSTDRDGYFKINGTCKQFTKIDPRVDIYHRCGKYYKFCYCKVSKTVPYEYVTRGKEAKKCFDVGNIKLKSKKSCQGTILCYRNGCRRKYGNF